MDGSLQLTLYKANLALSVLYGLASLVVCATFWLFHPHAVGHLAPIASAATAMAWALLCWQLGLANGLRHTHAILRAFAPFALGALAMSVGLLRYIAQVTA